MANNHSRLRAKVLALGRTVQRTLLRLFTRSALSFTRMTS
jgi:hypothetical protein